MLYTILQTLWLLIPAYTPNNFAVLFGGGTPVDLGKKFIDGKRILGDGKTIRGFVSGVLGGIFCGNIQYYAEKILGWGFYSTLAYTDFLIMVSTLSFGALFGDMVGSFIKRRFGIERGEKLPLFDQLTFLIFAFLFAYISSPYFGDLFSLKIVLTGFIITPFLHLLTNFIAYKLGLKDVPW